MEEVKRVVNQIAYAKDLSKLPFYKRSLIPFLSFASSIYKLAILLRCNFYHYGLFHKNRLPVPVISVGNLTWGGNGKTPMVEFIASWLASSGLSPLILTRGYAGGDEARMLRRHLMGTSVKIGIGANRAATAGSFLDKYGYNSFHDSMYSMSQDMDQKLRADTNSNKIGAAILDDGLQVLKFPFFLQSLFQCSCNLLHRAFQKLHHVSRYHLLMNHDNDSTVFGKHGKQHLSLWRGLEVVMVNGMAPWGNGQLLPLGPLREPLTALRRVDIAIIHHANLVADEDIKDIQLTIQEVKQGLPVFFSGMVPSHFFEIRNPSTILSLRVVNNTIILCVSAIGSANSFVEGIRKMGPCRVDRFDFSDHHSFQPQDIEMIRMRMKELEDKFDIKPIVVVTEKDYDRDSENLKQLHPFKVLVLCSQLQILPRMRSTEENFKNLLIQLLQAKFKFQGVKEHTLQ